ncbi:helix-turn-helix domain-containing protein [Mycolicibacterium gilvum]|uniref:helix-turn-helix domain-containing protein n=1 Tax=Mycolicibacterium gilvum TaxID=1804 RepID=UPI0015596AA7|nr:helix-turn-helix transcriptional regulator [Mycolicibacterium gilvum]MCV7056282.1 helix-turn-helix transcriptional regulator [Mycolicibacterium gilvum]
MTGDGGDGGAEVGFDQLVGANIRAYRTAIGMSQLELAEALGRSLGERVHQQTILKIEKGTRPLRFSEARAVAKVLGVQDYMLLAGREDRAARGLLLQLNKDFRGHRKALKEFAADLAPQLVDLALLMAALDQESASDEDGRTADLGPMKAWAESWLLTNWGRELNREIMSTLRKQEFMTDLRDEFKGDSYREVLDRVRGTELRPIHPSISQLAMLDALKYRPAPPDGLDDFDDLDDPDA